MEENTIEEQISHEEEVLKSFQNGDFSIMTEDWSIEKQEGFVLGMKHAYHLMRKDETKTTQG